MSKTIDCGMVGTSAVTAERDGDEVLVIVRETADDSAHFDLDGVREAVEATLGVWLDTLDMRTWSDTGSGSVAQTVALHGDQPTHRITVTAPSSEPRSYVVRLYAEDGGGTGPAYSRQEWDDAATADWELTEDGWLCQGQATPGGGNGTVEVTAL